MNKILTTAVAVCAGMAAAAQVSQPADTLPGVHLGDIVVLGTRAQANDPVTLTNITGRQLEAVNHGKDIPSLLQNMPSVLTTSDAGAGVGYTSLRIRGTDASRINVTVNDIPMNDAESHTIYWVNTPDLASSLADIQVQRGVGTSSNGAGAFGGSVNMSTLQPGVKPYAELSGSYGSFKTNKETLKVGTGLLGNHWIVEGRLSHIGSDGYRDRAESELLSYFGQLAYVGGKTRVKFITFGGREQTYHAWDGISREMLKTDRTYNPNGEIKHDGKVTGFYDDQNDVYRQTHYQLILDQHLAPRWNLNVALHYTGGYGYYQEYKNNRTLVEYRLTPFVDADGSTVKKSNLVRKKIVDSDFGGGVFSVRYTGNRLHATLGGAFNAYGNSHYGQVIWVENYRGTNEPEHEYYRNKGKKREFNIYLKGDYALWRGLSAYLDLQYRHIGYTIKGDNDKWDWTANPERLQVLDVDEKFNFFNPKVGLNWAVNDRHRAYTLLAVAHKEPTRNNYTDGPLIERPRAERLVDFELGYEYRDNRWHAGANFYYMRYHDQLVLNGRLNEIGEPMAENVARSYRLGIELSAGVAITPWLRWDVNATWSRNRIKDYVGYVSDYDSDWNDLYTQTAIACGDTPIAFSPSLMGNSMIVVDWRGLRAMLLTRAVSRQYLDNFGNRDDSLDPYCVNDLSLAYRFKLPHIRQVEAGVTLYNLFNTRYENNGYSQTAAVYDGGDKSRRPVLVSDPRFYPMAGINVLAHLTLKF